VERKGRKRMVRQVEQEAEEEKDKAGEQEKERKVKITFFFKERSGMIMVSHTVRRSENLQP